MTLGMVRREGREEGKGWKGTREQEGGMKDRKDRIKIRRTTV